MESQPTDDSVILLLSGEERVALTRVLRVVEDEWWLDDVERRLLERLDAAKPFLTAA